MELIGNLPPPAVVNVVTGPGGEIGKALAGNPRIAKIGFTGEITTGRLIMQYASEPIIPQTLELGGKSPNMFFADVTGRRRRLFRQSAGRVRSVRLQQRRSVQLPVSRSDSGVHLRPVPGTCDRPRGQDQGRQSARSGNHDGGTGFARSAGKDFERHQNRQA